MVSQYEKTRGLLTDLVDDYISQKRRGKEIKRKQVGGGPRVQGLGFGVNSVGVGVGGRSSASRWVVGGLGFRAWGLGYTAWVWGGVWVWGGRSSASRMD